MRPDALRKCLFCKGARDDPWRYRHTTAAVAATSRMHHCCAGGNHRVSRVTAGHISIDVPFLSESAVFSLRIEKVGRPPSKMPTQIGRSSMKNYSLSALVAAGLLAGGLATSANAADLGGNCCADLEERIAELEATTARKGNRKVSLTVSGWVGQQITFWDDGFESNTYVHDLGTTLGSHVKFTGSAQISPGWSAGYVLQIEAISSDGLTTRIQNNPDWAGCTGSATLAAFRRCSLTGSSSRTRSVRLASASSPRLRTTRRSSSTVRARSFPPTGWRSTSTASFASERLMVAYAQYLLGLCSVALRRGRCLG